MIIRVVHGVRWGLVLEYSQLVTYVRQHSAGQMNSNRMSRCYLYQDENMNSQPRNKTGEHR
jgi:hypothetical protein